MGGAVSGGGIGVGEPNVAAATARGVEAEWAETVQSGKAKTSTLMPLGPSVAFDRPYRGRPPIPVRSRAYSCLRLIVKTNGFGSAMYRGVTGMHVPPERGFLAGPAIVIV